MKFTKENLVDALLEDRWFGFFNDRFLITLHPHLWGIGIDVFVDSEELTIMGIIMCFDFEIRIIQP
jgi:hypothetical protein